MLRRHYNRAKGDGEAIAALRAYREVFASNTGQYVLHDMILRYDVLSSKELTPFEQGRRAVVLNILKLLENEALLTERIYD